MVQSMLSEDKIFADDGKSKWRWIKLFECRIGEIEKIFDQKVRYTLDRTIMAPNEFLLLNVQQEKNRKFGTLCSNSSHRTRHQLVPFLITLGVQKQCICSILLWQTNESHLPITNHKSHRICVGCKKFIFQAKLSQLMRNEYSNRIERNNFGLH